MHLPSQTERPLFIATRTLWGLLCPSLLLLLCSLSRVPRAQKPWTRPFLRYVQIQLPPFTTITMNNPSSFIHYFNFFRSFFWWLRLDSQCSENEKRNHSTSGSSTRHAGAEACIRVGGHWLPQNFEIFLNIYTIILIFSNFSLKK